MDDKADRTSRPAVDYGELNERIGYLLRRAQLAVFSDFFQTFSDFGISPAQYSILTVIGRNPGLSQTEVADALGIKKTNFVAVIKDLEKRGTVLRTAMPTDKRSFALTLPPSGLSLLTKLHAAALEHENRIRALFGADHYAALMDPLYRLTRLERQGSLETQSLLEPQSLLEQQRLLEPKGKGGTGEPD
jgi:DNA-binding MarR family transcriptional regulator